LHIHPLILVPVVLDLHASLITVSGYFFSTGGPLACHNGAFNVASAAIGWVAPTHFRTSYVYTNCTRIPNTTNTTHCWSNILFEFGCNDGFVADTRTTGRRRGSLHLDFTVYTVTELGAELGALAPP
jgi:hypothetical protein